MKKPAGEGGLTVRAVCGIRTAVGDGGIKRMMVRWLSAAAAVAMLAGCAPTLAGANERGGIVGNHGWSQAKSFGLAEAHCQKYGLHARVSGTNDYEGTMTFDCIP